MAINSSEHLSQWDRVYCHRHPDAQLIDDYDSGDVICPHCGLVVIDRMTNVIVDCASFTNENRKLVAAGVGCSENTLVSDWTNLSTLVSYPQNVDKNVDSKSECE